MKNLCCLVGMQEAYLNRYLGQCRTLAQDGLSLSLSGAARPPPTATALSKPALSKAALSLTALSLRSAAAYYNRGEVEDWIEFFGEPWAQALYHDRFHDFCLSLRMSMQGDEGINEVLIKVRKALESGAKDTELCQVRRAAVGVGGANLTPSTKQMVEMHLLDFLKVPTGTVPALLLPVATTAPANRALLDSLQNNKNLLSMYWPGL